jgi:hypothetical protein
LRVPALGSAAGPEESHAVVGPLVPTARRL